MTTRTQRLVDALRADPGRLDDIRRARMERDLIAAWKQRATTRLGAQAPERGTRRLRWVASVAVSGVLGGLVALYGAQRQDVVAATAQVADTPAYFEVRIGDAATQTGALVEGQTLASGDHGHVSVHIGATQIDMARQSRVRFERINGKELRVSLAVGEISVAYHPAQRDEQRLSIETQSANVLVVGTEFVVAVDPGGSTDVRVTEGIVRVMSRLGSDDHVLTAGDSTRIDAVASAPRPAAMESEPAAAFNADLDFGDSPEAIDIERLVGPTLSAQGATRHSAHAASSREQASEPSRDAVERMTPMRRLDLARALLRQGHHDQARTLLRALTEPDQSTVHQVEAWTLTAESYTAQGYVPRAADSYRRAADVGRGTQAGQNAVFAWARLLERHTRDQQAAVLVYERYLREAPEGALSLQAMDALCRLGVSLHCH